MELEGEAGALKGEDAPAHGAFQMGWMSSPGLRIAGGTDEILRNIIAERVLGLPQDVRVTRTCRSTRCRRVGDMLVAWPPPPASKSA